jgi:hypothetical protein
LFKGGGFGLIDCNPPGKRYELQPAVLAAQSMGLAIAANWGLLRRVLAVAKIQ